MTPVELHALAAEVLGIGPDRVQGALSFGEIPEWDSMAHVELMLALEERLGTEIGPELMVELTSVSAIEGYVAAQAAGGAGTESGIEKS